MKIKKPVAAATVAATVAVSLVTRHRPEYYGQNASSSSMPPANGNYYYESAAPGAVASDPAPTATSTPAPRARSGSSSKDEEKRASNEYSGLKLPSAMEAICLAGAIGYTVLMAYVVKKENEYKANKKAWEAQENVRKFQERIQQAKQKQKDLEKLKALKKIAQEKGVAQAVAERMAREAEENIRTSLANNPDGANELIEMLKRRAERKEKEKGAKVPASRARPTSGKRRDIVDLAKQ